MFPQESFKRSSMHYAFLQYFLGALSVSYAPIQHYVPFGGGSARGGGGGGRGVWPRMGN